MEYKHILSLDTTFDWNEAYTRNLCSLVNIQVVPGTTLKPTFLLDNVETVLGHLDLFHLVIYRDWQNPHWYGLGEEVTKKPLMWSTPQKAKIWLQNVGLVESGYRLLTRDEALETAELYLSTHEKVS